MKRLQIMIEEDLDAELERLSGRTGRSKAALIREFVRKEVVPLPPIEDDPMFRAAGMASFPRVNVDEALYGPVGPAWTKPRRRRRP